jgi:hypothetical protein
MTNKELEEYKKSGVAQLNGDFWVVAKTIFVYFPDGDRRDFFARDIAHIDSQGDGVILQVFLKNGQFYGFQGLKYYVFGEHINKNDIIQDET